MGGAMTAGSTGGREAGPDFGGGAGLEALWKISKLKLAVMLGLAASSGDGEAVASRGATPGVLVKLANSGMAGEAEEELKLPKSSAG